MSDAQSAQNTAASSADEYFKNRTERTKIVNALYAWINQRPGLEYGNYRDSKSYNQELRNILRDLHDARALLRYVDILSGIDAGKLADAFRHAYSGRLSWDGERLDYCTGQYWPTEYRRAAAAVLASAIWDHWRDSMVNDIMAGDSKAGERLGDRLRAHAKKTFGIGIQRRYFN